MWPTTTTTATTTTTTTTTKTTTDVYLIAFIITFFSIQRSTHAGHVQKHLHANHLFTSGGKSKPRSVSQQISSRHAQHLLYKLWYLLQQKCDFLDLNKLDLFSVAAISLQYVHWIAKSALMHRLCAESKHNRLLISTDPEQTCCGGGGDITMETWLNQRLNQPKG